LLSQKQGVRVQRAVNISIQALLRPNALFPPFNNPKARLALAYIVDQADVMAAGFGDERFWRVCNAYYVCGGPYGTEVGTEDFRPDPTKARVLLAAAGYHGEKMVFASTHEVAWIGHMTEVVANELKRAGVDVDIIWSDRGTMARRTASQNPPAAGGWNMFVSAAGAAMYDPLTNSALI
jgi:peptide/nickel transport system substrate-binding protein